MVKDEAEKTDEATWEEVCVLSLRVWGKQSQ